jgi:hypothetical protein
MPSARVLHRYSIIIHLPSREASFDPFVELAGVDEAISFFCVEVLAVLVGEDGSEVYQIGRQLGEQHQLRGEERLQLEQGISWRRT